MQGFDVNTTVGNERTASAALRDASYLLQRFLRFVLPLAGGFLTAGTPLFAGMYPFGTALIAALPRGFVLPAVVGAIVGSITSGGMAYSGDVLRLAASAVAVGGMRWALYEIKRINESEGFATVVAVVGTVLTGLIVSGSVGEGFGLQTLMYVCEGLSAGACAYFFSGAFRLLGRVEDGFSGLLLEFTEADIAEKSCALAAMCVLALPLCRISIGGFVPGAVLVMLAAVMCSNRFGAAGGAVAGIACGLMLALSGYGFSIAAVCAAAGLIASLFAPVGRLLCALTFALVCVVGAVAADEINVMFMAESTAACIGFMLIRQNVLDRLMPSYEVLSDETDDDRWERDDTNIYARLQSAAEGLNGVSETILEVSERIDRIEADKPEMVCRRAAKELCSSCAIAGHCWGDEGSRTSADFDRLAGMLRERGSIERNAAPEGVELKRHCARYGELCDTLNRRWQEYTAREQARRSITRVRSVIAEQLGGVAELLTDLSQREHMERQPSDMFDQDEIVNCIIDILVSDECIIDENDIECYIGNGGRLSIRIPDFEELLDGQELSERLGEVLDIGLDWSRNEDWLTLNRRPPLNVAFGAYQHCCSDGGLCGDAYDATLTRDGDRAAVLLSDGMGSGGHAAVDAAMTCALMKRLLKAGFGAGSALRLVNSALMMRSEDEALATADCLFIDLFSGQAEFVKAGAVRSYIKRGNSIMTVEKDSLPLGIMSEVDCYKARVEVEEGDVIVLLSDGILAQDERPEWLLDELTRFRTDADTPRGLAKSLVNLARAGMTDSDDDITAVVAVVHGNV